MNWIVLSFEMMTSFVEMTEIFVVMIGKYGAMTETFAEMIGKYAAMTETSAVMIGKFVAMIGISVVMIEKFVGLHLRLEMGNQIGDVGQWSVPLNEEVIATVRLFANHDLKEKTLEAVLDVQDQNVRNVIAQLSV